MVKHGGFTLVELITVMVVLGILSAVALPRMMNNSALAGSVFRSDVVSALRFAQKSAVSHRRLVCAALAPTEVTLSMVVANPETSCPAPPASLLLSSPDGARYQSKDGSVQASANPPVVGLLYFLPDGTIVTNPANPATTVYSGNVTITGQSTPIRIEGATGYVE